MKPIEILQGKWLGHPAHPAIVHIPLALWIGAAVIDVLACFGVGSEPLTHLALYGVVLGFAGAALAIPTGFADWLPIKPGKPTRKLGLAHMALNVTAAGLFLVNLILRFRALETAQPITPAVVATSATGALVLIASGYLGSLMTFDRGVSVARQSKDTWRELAEKGGSSVPPKT